MNNNRLGLYGLFVKVDLETQSWKGLAGPCDGFAISEQTQHAQIELSVDGFALALGIAPFEGGLAAFYAHPVIQRGLAGRQACQTERGRALHACLAIVIAPLAYLGKGQVGAQLQDRKSTRLNSSH